MLEGEMKNFKWRDIGMFCSRAREAVADRVAAVKNEAENQGALLVSAFLPVLSCLVALFLTEGAKKPPRNPKYTRSSRTIVETIPPLLNDLTKVVRLSNISRAVR